MNTLSSIRCGEVGALDAGPAPSSTGPAMAAGFRHSKSEDRYDPQDPANVEKRTRRGHDDGHNLIVALELMRRLPGCFVPVPEHPSLNMAREYGKPPGL